MESMNTEKSENDQLRVLWSSNATFAPTGYGVQTGNVAVRLKRQGFNVRVAANYGLEGAALGFNELVQYPRLFAQFGEDALQIICDNWKPHVFVSLYDIWIGAMGSAIGKDWFRKLSERWIPWIPIDQNPISDQVVQQASLAHKRVAMTRFGQEQLKACGLDSTYIPHGVETNVFKPVQDKCKVKGWLEEHSSPLLLDEGYKAKITSESFVVGTNMANKDPIRKDWARTFTAFQIFLEQNPDAKKDAVLYLHTWLSFPGGFDLVHLAKKLGIGKNVKHTFVYDMFCSLPSAAMSSLYNGFDVLMNLARGEGFGVPQLEAMSCGVPCVSTDFSAMHELVDGHGWLVAPYARDVKCPDCGKEFSYGCKDGARAFDHLISMYAIPDEWKAAEALGEAYNHPEKREAYGRASREFALNYDFDNVVAPKWVDLLNEVKSEMGMFGNAKAKDTQFDDIFKEALR